jgi:hypothetical protein
MSLPTNTLSKPNLDVEDLKIVEVTIAGRIGDRMSKMEDVAKDVARKIEESEQKVRQTLEQQNKRRQDEIAQRSTFSANVTRLYDDLEKWLAPLQQKTGSAFQPGSVTLHDGQGEYDVPAVELVSETFRLQFIPHLHDQFDAEAYARAILGKSQASLILRNKAWFITWQVGVADREEVALTEDTLSDFVSFAYEVPPH